MVIIMERMKELIAILNQAAKSYYADNIEIMNNFEYDKLYDELVLIEEQLGITLANSPTIRVGYEAVDELPKEAHEQPMLSLGKTKEREELVTWLNGEEGILSWKLDGLTVVLTYENGMLQKAVTRGNGEVGEVITNNAKVFINLPLTIPYKGKLVLRGEAVISYDDFQAINMQIEDVEAKYKNPRNLCSGSVRQLNNQVTKSRKVGFYGFGLVEAENVEFENKRENQFCFLKEQGFEIVPHEKVSRENIISVVEQFEKNISTYKLPSDGLVLIYDNIAYGQSLGTTAKFPRDSIAFKWADELKETVLLEIEWSASRTGLINPVAIFESVELEGTTVSRASLHNISILQGLKLGIGDTVTVYKANMIIPQIAENLTLSDNVVIPESCPVCGEKTRIEQINEVRSLYCVNPQCSAKKIKSFSLFVSRNALNIEGLSEATLEKFIGKGFLHEFADIFHLERYMEKIISMEGFGQKSYENLQESIEKARHTTLPKLIYGLGIENIGVSTAKLICKEFENEVKLTREADMESLSQIDGVGEVIATAFMAYMSKEENKMVIDHLLEEVIIESDYMEETKQILAGKTFVITGSLEEFANRNVFKEKIEQLGGKVTGSVTGKTDGLINNDATSQSSKNKKAKSLGVPIITEKEFIELYGID